MPTIAAKRAAIVLRFRSSRGSDKADKQEKGRHEPFRNQLGLRKRRRLASPIRAAIIALLCFILEWPLVLPGYAGPNGAARNGRKEGLELKTKFEQRQQKAANLEEYKAQMAEIEKSFGDLLRQLPDKTQVPELLVDVSQTDSRQAWSSSFSSRVLKSPRVLRGVTYRDPRNR